MPGPPSPTRANHASPNDVGLRDRPPSNKRVRTGCWPCRRRHRKCDERRPTCENCQTKRLTCQYPATFIFAPVMQTPARETNNDSAAPVPPQRQFTFVNDGAFEQVQTSSPGASPITWQAEHSGILPCESVGPSDILVFDDDTLDQGENVPVESCGTPISGVLRLPPRRSSHSSPTGLSPSEGSYPNSNGLFLATTDNERSCLSGEASGSVLSLIRYYRYEISPLLDFGDPWSSFTIQVPMLARSEGPVRRSILSLSARHHLLRTKGVETSPGEDVASLELDIDQGILGKDDPVHHVSQSLLLFMDFSSVIPQQWKEFIRQKLPSQDLLRRLPSQHDLTNSAFWLLFKMDLAASLMCRAPLSITVPSVKSLGIPHEGDQRSHLSYAYLSSIILLARTLDLIYTKPGKPKSENLQNLTDFGPQEFPLNSESWTNLWYECQDWYRDRPLEMQPTMSVNILEATRISHSENCHLPIIMFPLPLAVVANIAYHTACFFLMVRKPRLCHVVHTRSQMASSTRHIQSIAGIATSNNFAGQWDLITIAALFRSARKLTHESQHEAVLDVFQKVTAVTGIRLERETQELRDIQRASQRE